MVRSILICLTAVLCLAGVGYGGLRAYRAARQHRVLKAGRVFLSRSETRKALFCAQRALRADPHDVEALRLLADLDEISHSPAALLARSRVVELLPRSREDRMALVRTALVLRDLVAATNALDAVPPADRANAAFQTLAGAVAASLNQTAEAETHFIEAARLEPGNPVADLNLAVVRLHAGRGSAVEEARSCLIRLSENSTNPMLRCQALRERVIDATRSHQPDSALRLCQRLLGETNSVFRDQLLYLDILHGAKAPQFEAALTAAQRSAAAEPARIYEMATWQMGALGARETGSWLQSLPPASRTNQPAVLLAAECEALIPDWAALQARLSSQRWQELDFMRRAFLARALRGLQLTDSSKGEWEQAIQGCGRQKASLIMLLRLASEWGWVAEQQDILWSIFNEFPGEEWAYRSLAQGFFLTGQTRSLMTLYSGRVSRVPSDLPAKNNLAMTALLLGARERQSHKLALDLYTQAPDNPTFASTYAFSLILQTKAGQALAVLERLKPKALEDPSLAGYYGLALHSVGNHEKARRYLNLGLKAHLLPEERKIFDQALAGG